MKRVQVVKKRVSVTAAACIFAIVVAQLLFILPAFAIDDSPQLVRIMDLTGNPVVGADIFIVAGGVDTTAGVFSVVDLPKTDENGESAVPRKDGDQRVHAIVICHPAYGCFSHDMQDLDMASAMRPDKRAVLTFPAETRSITGRVVDEAGNPVSGVEVCPLSSSTGFEVVPLLPLAVQTAADGSFALSPLPSMIPYPLRARLGHEGIGFHGYHGSGHFDFAPSSSAESVEIVIAPGATLSGKVAHGITGEPVSGVNVRLTPSPYGIWETSIVKTDEEGSYTAIGLPPAMFQVWPMPVNGLFAGSVRISSNPPVAAEASDAGDEIHEVKVPLIQMWPGVPVAGGVVDATTGAAPSGLDVSLYLSREQQHPNVGKMEIGDDGQFEVLDAPGLVTVEARCANCDILPDSKEQRLILQADAGHQDLVVRVKPYDTFACSLRLPDGRPAAGAVVREAWRDPAFEADESGIAQIGLEAREYKLERPQMKVFLGELREGEQLLRGAAGTKVQAPETTALAMHLHPVSSVSGVVVNDSGNPLAGVHVSCTVKVETHTLTEGAVVTGEDGRFSFAGVLPGFPTQVRAGGALSRIERLEPGASQELPPLRYVEFKADGNSYP
jgi:hypothetical protein